MMQLREQIRKLLDRGYSLPFTGESHPGSAMKGQMPTPRRQQAPQQKYWVYLPGKIPFLQYEQWHVFRRNCHMSSQLPCRLHGAVDPC